MSIYIEGLLCYKRHYIFSLNELDNILLGNLKKEAQLMLFQRVYLTPGVCENVYTVMYYISISFSITAPYQLKADW